MSGFEVYKRFIALHTREGGLLMPNAWDGLPARSPLAATLFTVIAARNPHNP